MRMIIAALATILLFSQAFAESLLQRADFEHIGSFRIPTGRFGTVSTADNSFSEDSGRGLAYNPANNSLFFTGKKSEQLLAELNIPTIIKNSNKTLLNFATVRQNPIDIFGGNRCLIGPNGTNKCGGAGVLTGGTLLDGQNGKLIVQSFAPYNGEEDITRSHFTANADWSSSVGSNGAFVLSSNPAIYGSHLTAGFVDGYTSWIPDSKRSTFGGDAVAGQSALSVINRTSLGPALFVYNTSDLTTGRTEGNPVTATPLLYYDASHPTLGTYSAPQAANPTFNVATEITGSVWVSGSRSVLFFGRTGLGEQCYGAGTSVESEEATNQEIAAWISAHGGTLYTCGTQSIDASGGNACCYDPASSAKGDHAYPYAYYVWAYDTNDLLDVKNGIKNPWEVEPYAEWNLNDDLDVFAPTDGNKRIFGAAYDSANQRIFIPQVAADKYTYEAFPIIQVYSLNVQSGNRYRLRIQE